MTSHVDEEGFEVDRETLADRVESFFDDLEPHTAEAVATGLGISRSTAADRLDDLVASGLLARKTVGDETTVWYRDRPAVERPSHSGGESGDPDEETVAARIDATVEGLSVPGTSEMMRSWRRDAVRAAATHVVEAGPATPGEIRSAVYPGHAAGFDDADAWWSMIEPRLDSIPGVLRDGETFAFDGDRMECEAGR